MSLLAMPQRSNVSQTLLRLYRRLDGEEASPTPKPKLKIHEPPDASCYEPDLRYMPGSSDRKRLYHLRAMALLWFPEQSIFIVGDLQLDHAPRAAFQAEFTVGGSMGKRIGNVAGMRGAFTPEVAADSDDGEDDAEDLVAADTYARAKQRYHTWKEARRGNA